MHQSTKVFYKYNTNLKPCISNAIININNKKCTNISKLKHNQIVSIILRNHTKNSTLIKLYNICQFINLKTLRIDIFIKTIYKS